MKYWMKVRWPKLRDVPSSDGIRLQDGLGSAARDMRPGDLVFEYESKNGRKRVDGLEYCDGRRGIVALAEVTEINIEQSFETEAVEYENFRVGKTVGWNLVARLRVIDDSRYCPNEDVCDCFGYVRGFHFMGFGKGGLKQLSEEQFRYLRDHFR